MKKVELRNEGKNLFGIEANVTIVSSPGYEEIFIDINNGKKSTIASIAVTVDPESGEPKVLMTSGGVGDGDLNIVVYPTRPLEKAVETIK